MSRLLNMRRIPWIFFLLISAPSFFRTWSDASQGPRLSGAFAPFDSKFFCMFFFCIKCEQYFCVELRGRRRLYLFTLWMKSVWKENYAVHCAVLPILPWHEIVLSFFNGIYFPFWTNEEAAKRLIISIEKIFCLK